MNAVAAGPYFAALSLLTVLVVLRRWRLSLAREDRQALSARLARNAEERAANRRGGYYAILSRTAGTEPTVHTYLRRHCLAGDSDRFRSRPWRRLSVRAVECGEEWRDRFAAM